MTTDPLDFLDPEDKQKKAGDILDHTPLMFGKYRGKTPEWVSENDPKYLVWMCETVTDKATCSDVLYRECGGTRGRAGPRAPAIPKMPDSMRLKDHFDDYDDDIPF